MDKWSIKSMRILKRKLSASIKCMKKSLNTTEYLQKYHTSIEFFNKHRN